MVGIGIAVIILFLSKSDKNESNVVGNNQELIEVHDDGSVDIIGMDSFLILDEDDLITKEELQKKVDDGKMSLKFNSNIHIQNGKEGTCSIANSEMNKRDMYVSLWLVDTQEEIYRSGLIPVGNKIEQLELNRSLEVGKYSAILVHNQLENNEIVSQVNVEVTLIVSS
ncbi:MAG: hypothetical protein J6A58_14630 [Oscillospiraceae bacterium]|nr:hypothetical protein [Oscillospiraceae bacterium]